jgi:UDP-N-acetylmuramyl pentapeptide phosphotransferase/UDP-N-acetylglucosamine-1-phosphate transferase
MNPTDLPDAWPAWLVAALAGSFLLARVWRHWALRRGVVDRPEDRRLHAEATPRGGGIGIALALLLATPAFGSAAWAFAGGLALVAGIGLLDDLRPLPAGAKAIGQAIGAAPLAWALPLAPAWFGPLLAVVAAWLLIVALVNIWNFMDGSNGLAASQAMLFGLCLAGLADGPARWLGLVLAAACLGFLPQNFPRARVFLGDVGSHALGFAVAAGVLAAGEGGVPPWLALLPAAAFLVDASLTLAARLLRGERFWQAHREHLYQRAIAAGAGHAPVCLAYALVTAAVGAAALALARSTPAFALPGAATVLALVLLAYLILRRRWPMAPRTAESS